MSRTAFGVNLGFRKLPDGSIQMSNDIKTPRGVRIRAHLPRRARIAYFGYSIDNFAGSLISEETKDGPIPGGATPTIPVLNGTKIAIAQRSKKVHAVCNCGVSGETTSQMLARSSAAGSTTRKSIYDCIEKRPDIDFLTGPLVNDGSNWTVNTTKATADAAVERAKIIISELAASIPFVAFVGCMGINIGGWDAERLAHVQGLMSVAVSELAAWAEANFDNVIFMNPEGRLSIGQSWIDGLSDDGVHPNMLGGSVFADMQQEVIDDLFSTSITDPVIYDFHKDWATVVSNRPTGVAAPTAVSSAVVGTASTAEGVYSQPFTTPSNTAGIYFEVSTLESALVSAGLVTGDAFFIEWDLELLDSDGNPKTMWTVESFTRLYNATNEAGAYLPSQSESYAPNGRNGWCTPVIKLDRNASALGSSSGTRITVRPKAAGSWILKVYAPKIRKYTTALAS